MKAELIYGTLVKVEDDQLTILRKGELEPIEAAYPSHGLLIDDGWVKRFLGNYVQCKLVDGIIIDVVLSR